KKITALAETSAEGSQAGYVYENFEGVYILDQDVVFGVEFGWANNAYALWQGKQATFNSIKSDGGQRNIIKVYKTHYLQTRAGEFGEIYIRYEENDDYAARKVDEYKQGKLESSLVKADDFYNEEYPRYVVSPSGDRVLFSENRDGKNVFLVGDNKGENGKEIGR